MQDKCSYQNVNITTVSCATFSVATSGLYMQPRYFMKALIILADNVDYKIIWRGGGIVLTNALRKKLIEWWIGYTKSIDNILFLILPYRFYSILGNGLYEGARPLFGWQKGRDGEGEREKEWKRERERERGEDDRPDPYDRWPCSFVSYSKIRTSTHPLTLLTPPTHPWCRCPSNV